MATHNNVFDEKDATVDPLGFEAYSRYELSEAEAEEAARENIF